MEEVAGWLVQADDARLIVDLASRLAGCQCPGSCRCSGGQLLEDLLCSPHLILASAEGCFSNGCIQIPKAFDGLSVGTQGSETS